MHPFRRVIPWGLALIALAGVVSSFSYSRQLHELRRQRSELTKRVGLLNVTDPERVHVTWVATGEDEIPPGVEEAHVWRFRIYLPANYGPCIYTRSRAVAADSPRSQGGGGSSWSSKEKDPVETQMTIALIKVDGRWMMSRVAENTSSATSFPDDLSFESLGDVVIDTVVSEGEPSTSFSKNDPICLVRVRGKEPIENNRTEVELYPGFVCYLVEADRRVDLERWARGEVDAMPEVEP